MRVLVCTTANAGHFGPLVPLARACSVAGHDVVVAAPTSFAGQVAAAGFEYRPFADVPPELAGPVFSRLPSLTLEQANEVMVKDVFGRLNAQAAWPGIADIIGDWGPQVLVREPAEFGSAAAARCAGVPQATVAIGVSAMGDYLASLLAAPLAGLDVLAGLPEGAAAVAIRTAPTFSCVPSVLDNALDSPALDSPALDSSAPDEIVVHEGEVRAVGAGPVHRFRDDALVSDTAALPGEWGDPAQPLVYVTFGSVTARHPDYQSVYAGVLSAMADQPVRILLTTGDGLDPAAITEVPGNARVERWWPQRDVLPAAAAVVSHGGFGTTMAALAAGVPQVVVPLFAIDQHINARHVAAVGAGVHLDGGLSAVPALPGALRRLLDGDAPRQAARVVAEEMAGLPPASEMVGVLERLAHR